MSVLKIALRVDRCFDAVKTFIHSKGIGGFGVREVAGESNDGCCIAASRSFYV